MKHFVAASAVLCCVLVDPAGGRLRQGAPGQSGVPELVRAMAGTWSVEQRMWPGSKAAAVDLPPAVARRRLVRGGFLEEIMDLAPGSSAEPFTRIAYFHFNAVTRRYEYVSLDSRAPQLMTERSDPEDSLGQASAGRDVRLNGDVFLAPRWGDATDVEFRYHLTVGEVVRNRQVVPLYLTPRSGNAGEFLAFEYVYTRRAPAK